jgi:peroxiredoxin Q/BCP
MIDFSLSTDTGESLTLSSLRGRTVILYFYPKDDTSGCTQESCEFRDRFPRFVASDAVVLGISPDDVASHRKFKAKYNLPFTLLVDENHALAERLGIWVEKLFYGKKYMGVQRTTYIIGVDGEVKHVFEKVNPAGHADEVMAFLAGGVEAAQRARAEYDAIAAKAAVKPVKKPAKKVVKKAAKKPTRKLVKKVARKPAKKPARKVIKKSIKKVATRKKTSSKTARHGK